MPIVVQAVENTTLLSFLDRCTAEDATVALPELKTSLQSAPKLKIESNDNASVDTGAFQFMVCATQACQDLLNPDDNFVVSTLQRWGFPPLDIESN